jgi:hypothetical protein
MGAPLRWQARCFPDLRRDGETKRFDRSRYFGATEAQFEASTGELACHGFSSVRLERAKPGGEFMTAVVAIRKGRSTTE